MGVGIVGLAVLFAIISAGVIFAVMSIGQARWQRREGDSHVA